MPSRRPVLRSLRAAPRSAVTLPAVGPVVVPVVAALVVALAGCGLGGSDPAPAAAPASGASGATGASSEPTGDPATAPAPTPSGTPSASPSASPGTTPAPTSGATPAQRPSRSLSAADRAAGLRSRSFPQRGTGRLVVVPGSAKAPRKGRLVKVRVEVEGGLKVDGAAFADFALATLNDPRSWAHDGYVFARTDGAADVRLVLASPDTSARMCLPLRTFGRLSCHSGDATVITVYRWVKGIPEYGADRTGYRHYVVNHEVGHALGRGHLMCPGRGKRAPVMMQQTKGLKGCTPNGWPYP